MRKIRQGTAIGFFFFLFFSFPSFVGLEEFKVSEYALDLLS